MPATYEPIATTTLASAAASITFGSIPNTYTDLRVVMDGSTGGSAYTLQAQFNSDTGTNYSRTVLRGDGASATSVRATSATSIGIGQFGSYRALISFDVMSYTSGNYKTVLGQSAEDSNGSGMVYRTVGLWRSTAAVTSVVLTPSGGDFNAGTTATLYGIKAA